MKRASLTGATAVGFVLGALLVNAVPASAQWAVEDAQAIKDRVIQIAKETGIYDVITTMSQVQNFINSGIADFNKAIGLNTYGDTNTLLLRGFTQEANYSKAQIGALQQIFDGSNTAMARYGRDVRNAQIRDEQTASPAHCTALDGGVSTQSAAVQAFRVAQTIKAIGDARGEAGEGMPSHYGQAQGVASMAMAHATQYCNADDVAAHLCTLSANPNGDQKAASLFGNGVYADQAAVDAAKDYAFTIIQPVAPADLRGDQLASVNGQDAAVHRRAYNGRISLARDVVADALAAQVPNVPLTAAQTQYLTNMGLPAPASGNSSWLQVLQIEAQRRVSDVSWHTALQSMTPAAVQREVALELALNNYLLFESYKMNLRSTAISATQLAESTERELVPTTRLSTPSLAAN